MIKEQLPASRATAPHSGVRVSDDLSVRDRWVLGELCFGGRYPVRPRVRVAAGRAPEPALTPDRTN